MSRSLVAVVAVSLSCHGAGDRRAPTAPTTSGDPAHVVIQSGHDSEIQALAWSPDGKVVAAAAGQSVKLFDPAGGFVLADLAGHLGPVRAIAFSPDGQLLASASQDSTVRLWDVSRAAFARSLDGPDPVPMNDFGGSYLQAQQLAGVAFAPDGNRVAACTYDGRVRIWDVKTGAVRADLGKAKHYAESRTTRAQPRISFSGDGRYLAVIDDRLDVALWDVTTNTRADTAIPSLDDGWTPSIPNDGWTISIAFQPGSSRIARAGRRVLLWDVATRTEVAQFGAPRGVAADDWWPRAVAFSSDRLATLSRDDSHDGLAIEIVDLKQVRSVRQISTSSPDAKAIALSPDGRTVAVGLKTGRIARWDVDTGHAMPSLGVESADRVYALAFAGPLLVTSGRSSHAWDLGRAEVVRNFDGHRVVANAMAVRGDGAVVASGAEDGAVRLWSVATGEPMPGFELEGEVGKLAFVGQTQLAALVFEKRGTSVQLWDLVAGERRWRRALPDRAIGLGVDPDHGTVATGTWEGDVQLWDAATGTPGRRLRAPQGPKPGTDPGPIAGFVFSRDRLWVADGYMVRGWELATGKLAAEWIAHDKPVLALALSPDGSTIATGGADGHARVWDVATAKRLHDLEGHADMVWTIAFSPDGKRLATASQDGTSRIWDPASGRLLATLSSFSDGEFIARAPDGSYNASLEGAGRVAVVFTRPLEAFSFEQFAAQLLRPAAVVAALRGERSGAAPTWTRPPIAAATVLPGGGIRVSARASAGLSRIRTFVDGRCPANECDHAITGQAGSIDVKPTLAAGANVVTAIAYDRNGLASTPVRVDMTGPAQRELPDLYVIGVGVSRYSRLDHAQWLRYAASDARALVGAFETQRGTRYRHVWKRLLTDEAVTRASVTSAITGLRAMRPDDVAIVYLGGHGVRGTGDDFHFLSSTSTLADLTDSVTWTDLARELRGVRGRVLLLLDACHAGRVSTDLVVPNEALIGQLVQRDAGGVLVLAASKGRQVSFESDRFGGGHGAFTWAVLQALGRDADLADTNGDGAVGVDELVAYTREWVGDVIGGEQTPWVARRELFGDFVLMSRK